MAEILISLTIIGVIAAITLPALQANINESAWKAQRKALYSRMSQAISLMPSLNGYGTYVGSWSDDNVSVTADTAAQAFVTDGLNKVLNINNICSIPMTTTNPTDRHKELAKCGIPDKLTTMANSKMPFPTNLTELNPMFTSTDSEGHRNPQKYINTVAVAFGTNNGESIAVFYNPYCLDLEQTKFVSNSAYAGFVAYAQPCLCANFIFDLNGNKGPNKVGKDIGFITAMYPSDSEVVMPVPLAKGAKNGQSVSYSYMYDECRKQDRDSRPPTRDELAAMFYNKRLVGIESSYYYSSTISTDVANGAWGQNFVSGLRLVSERSTTAKLHCVKR